MLAFAPAGRAEFDIRIAGTNLPPSPPPAQPYARASLRGDAEGYISRALPILGNLTAHGGTHYGAYPRGSTARVLAALVASPWLPPHLTGLPVVEVGTNDGTDFAVPTALLGKNRIYCFEPSAHTFRRLTGNLDSAGVRWVNSSEARRFHRQAPGSVLAYQAAVSNATATASFTEASSEQHNFANSLTARRGGMPGFVKGVRHVEVAVVTLDDVLAHERAGVLMLKIDSQGYEYHILRGAMRYILRRPVLCILLEFTPKLLLAAGVQPIELLRLLRHTLGYQCFDLSPPEHTYISKRGAASAPLSVSFADFLQRYRPLGSNFGQWTDLLCLNFALMR